MNLRRCRREHNCRLLECALPGRPFARPCATGVRVRAGATPGSCSDAPGPVGFSRGTEPVPAGIQVADARRRVRGRTTESSVWPDPLRAPRSSWLPILHRLAGNRTAGGPTPWSWSGTRGRSHRLTLWALTLISGADDVEVVDPRTGGPISGPGSHRRPRG